MENWTIVIRGVGQHHSRRRHDADKMARDFVSALAHYGHDIKGASFTFGGAFDLVEGTEFSVSTGDAEPVAGTQIGNSDLEPCRVVEASHA